jgi:hypothetical protein
MSRVLIVITALVLLNCQSTPISDDFTGQKSVSQAADVNQPTNCLTNNQSEACALTLNTIDYELPETSCNPYELVVDISTGFYTPAGLGDGSTSRIDWEFLPAGNGGFWTTSIDQPVPPNTSGTMSMTGCFTFGNQQTLKITRTIIDQLGNTSNELIIEVDRPEKAKTATHTQPAFEYQTSAFTLN